MYIHIGKDWALSTWSLHFQLVIGFYLPQTTSNNLVIIIKGNFGPTIMQKKTGGELVAEIYKQNNEPFIGIFGALRPMLVVRDPKIIRSILIKDFHHFVDRGVYIGT